MKILYFLLFPIFCYSQSGTISGNAYWKYNDFVGNKADAGSDVYAYPADSSIKTLNTQCDVQGNFRFEKVKPGKYLVVIFSKNTNTIGDDNLLQLQYSNTKPYLGFDVKEFDKPLLDSIGFYQKDYQSALEAKLKTFSMKKWQRNIDEKRETYQNAIHRLLSNGPVNSKTMWFQFPLKVQTQYYIKEIEITGDETVTIIADFGTTYL